MRKLIVIVCTAVVVAVTVATSVSKADTPMPTCTNQAVTCKTGQTSDGSTWKIEVPGNWNGTLLLYSHGYEPPTGPNLPGDDYDPTTSRTVPDYLLGQGFALAGSSYPASGWAVAEAFQDQEALLTEFGQDFGKPKTTIAWGHSMGGMITTGLIQLRPDQFSGALAMCGLEGGGVGLWNTNLDVEVAFKTLMMRDPNPAVSGPASTLQITNITDGNANTGAAEAALAAAQKTMEGRARIALVAAMIDLPNWFSLATPEPGSYDYADWEQNQFLELQVQLAFVFGFHQDLEKRAGGNPAWNVGIDYAKQLQRSADRDEVNAFYQAAGLDLNADLAAINATPRIKPDPAAVSYLEKNIVYTGNLQVPLLTMHTTSDWLVPYQHERSLRTAAIRAKRSDLLQQIFVHRPGHCAFTGAETVAALNVLLDRLDTGSWHNTNDPSALDDAASALGSSLNTYTPPVPGAPAIPTVPSFVIAHPSPFLRPFVLPPGGNGKLP